MTDIDAFLKRVLRGMGLSRHEQAAWTEEMSSHLLEHKQDLMQQGHTETDASRMAIEQFGSVPQLRRRVARETFGLSLWAMRTATGMFLALFLTGIVLGHLAFPPLVVLRHGNVLAWQHQHRWLLLLTNQIPVSPSLMLALALDVWMLRKTRKRTDRIALLSVTVVFGIVWVIVRLSHHQAGMLKVLFVTDSFAPYASLGAVSLLGFLMLLVWSISLYLWTGNKSVARMPIILSIAVSTWPAAKGIVQWYLWQGTHWPTFWGMQNPATSPVDQYQIFALMVRLSLMALATRAFRAIDGRTLRGTADHA